MAMNVEMVLVRTDSIDQVVAAASKRLQSPPDEIGRQPDWGLPRSYDVLIARDPKRKIAVSPPTDGWIALVESKEVIDFALAQTLSELLEAEVVAIQLSEVTGCCGYALCSSGSVIETLFDDREEDPGGRIHDLLEGHGIATGLVMFREAVQDRRRGWQIIGPP
jgi:hypothetical protein